MADPFGRIVPCTLSDRKKHGYTLNLNEQENEPNRMVLKKMFCGGRSNEQVNCKEFKLVFREPKGDRRNVLPTLIDYTLVKMTTIY